MHNVQVLPQQMSSVNESNEQLFHRWCFLLEQGRRELHVRQWFIADNYYLQAMLIAESLFSSSLCKSCALRCYMRTLIEYAYVNCKMNGPDSLDFLGQVATVTLARYTPMPLIDKLLEPLDYLKLYSDDERDLWINQLFVGDVLHANQLH